MKLSEEARALKEKLRETQAAEEDAAAERISKQRIAKLVQRKIRSAAESDVWPTATDPSVAALLSRLPPRHAAVLVMRFGLSPLGCMTLKAAGAAIGVSHERLRQMEAKALRMLRGPWHKHLLFELYFVEDPSAQKLHAAITGHVARVLMTESSDANKRT